MKGKEDFLQKIMIGLIAIVFAYYVIKDALCKGDWLCMFLTGSGIFAIVVLAVKQYWGIKK